MNHLLKEASFINHDLLNLRNMHYWSIENPRWLRSVDKQKLWRVNVWCGILNKQIIDSYFISGTLNREKNVTFLQNRPQMLVHDAPLDIQNISLDIRQSMWFQQDGCPAHSARNVTKFLSNKFGDRWIGRSGSNKWPVRSPVLTPLDFYLWEKLKEQVYREKLTTKVDVQERIKRACSVIDTNEICEAVSSVLQRFRLCISMFKVDNLNTCTSVHK
ncbi:hypothetical protein WH47_04088 [Habropoda laboriosa]|uniref:Transposable element Tc3 transposase n=1 Tax=Habropoda laboriosa TaxID=597456 RepID=A0A0L7QXN6_9HYME|nr:hypothetical protein WH47_04088 [Habropoda laboriosa]